MAGENVYSPDTAREPTPDSQLHLAAESGDFKMLELLLCKGADVNKENGTVETPLVIAVDKGHLRIVELLIKYGADVNVKDDIELTPLHINSFDKFEDRLDLSAESEIVQLEIAKLLLNNGANLNAQTMNGLTALHIAIRNGLYALAHLLLRSNADVNLADKFGVTALHLAARSGSKNLASHLLAKGADVNVRTFDGTAALNMAVLHDHQEVAVLLLENGAQVNSVDKYGISPFYCLSESWGYNLKDFGTVLLNWGAEVNCKTKKGRTALHTAAQTGHVGLVKFLIENGALVDCGDNKGNTPLHRASSPTIIDTLMKLGASVNCRRKDGRTALHLRSSHCDETAVAALLECGADINIKCHRGRTALDWTHFDYEGGLRDTDVDGYVAASEFSSADTRHVLLCHQAKMEAIGLHVQESQFSARFEETLEGFRKSCQEEVLLLRGEFINGTTVSYYDIVRKDVRFLAKYMNNENVVQASESEEYRSKYPTYAIMIKRQFEKGRARKKLLKAAYQVLSQLIDLPDFCTDRIMDYLCDDHLAVLIDV